jgi:dihydrodipicolinate synthase/N-acetylneuraminate lyase
MLLSGIFSPITTPFYLDGQVYFRKLEHNVEHYSKTPISGMTVLGSTGEAILLSDEERRDVLKAAYGAAADGKVLIAGTGVESALETLRLTEYAAQIGYDLALVRTPHFYKSQLQPANLLAFYRTVADSSALPVLIYNFPQCTGYDMPVELVAELSEHPNIVGIKESSANLEKLGRMVQATRGVRRKVTVTDTFRAVTPRMLRSVVAGRENGGELVSIGGATPPVSEPRPSSSSVSTIGGLKTREKEVGFQILAGAAHQLAPSFELGAVGAIVAVADFAPTACYEVYAAWQENDAGLAAIKQERINPLSTEIVRALGIAGVKYAMDLNGYYGGQVRLPLLPLTEDLRKRVQDLTANTRN